MSYIGLPPKATFSSGLLDRFTSTTGTTVTLTHDIASENDIVVFVNFVKQDSTTYSVGGTGNKTLTLGGTLVSSDIVEVHYLNIVGQTVAPSSGSVGSSQLTSGAVTGAKLNTDVISAQTELASGVASTDELLISDAGVLKRVDVSLVGGNNTPAFHAQGNATQTLPSGSTTKLTFATEVYDSSSKYDTSTSRFTPGEAGKFFLFVNSRFNADNGSGTQQYEVRIYKNGSQQSPTMISGVYDVTAQIIGNYVSGIVTSSNSTDYFEIYAYADGTNRDVYTSRIFGGYKIIE